MEALTSKEMFKLHQLDRVKLKGKVKPTDIYELVFWENQLKGTDLDHFMNLYNTGLHQYFPGQFDKAINNYKECLIQLLADPATQILLKEVKLFNEQAPSGLGVEP